MNVLKHYRKKPVIVQAVQFDVCQNEKYSMVGKEERGDPKSIMGSEVKFYVTTIHGQRAYLCNGDWIIKEPDGVHYYPCQDDVFKTVYEALE
jgi:hypothetical protein